MVNCNTNTHVQATMKKGIYLKWALTSDNRFYEVGLFRYQLKQFIEIKTFIFNLNMTSGKSELRDRCTHTCAEN